MKRLILSGRMALAVAAVMAASSPAHAQSMRTTYPAMAPLDQYLIADQTAEVALARTAAPRSIADQATVMVLGRDGYKVAAQGTNGFVCMVERGWAAAIGNPVFWNPKNRSPICLNAAAARTYLPISVLKTQLVIAGKSQAEIGKALEAAFRQGKLRPVEPGAMCYMMSKQGYLNDQVGHWHPHVMFFVPLAMSKTWGANLDGSPVLSGDDVSAHLTIYMIPVARWSDGTADASAGS